MKEHIIPSMDGKSQLHVVLWEPQGEAVGIVQVSHGMVEYIERYGHFASFLNEHGYVVVGNDHLGHGKTACSSDHLGYFCESAMSQTVVEDLKQVTLWIQEKYPKLPCFLFGHSMGSFMARRYMMTYGTLVDGVILCGTGSQPNILVSIATVLTQAIKRIKGDFHRSKLLKRLFFMNYDNHSKNDWLTRDPVVIDHYNKDPLCTYDFTVNGYRTLLEVLSFIQDESNICHIPEHLPVYLIAGTADPVGHYGKDITSIHHQYRNRGMKDVEMKLYDGCRHELVNETNKEDIFLDVLNWLTKHGEMYEPERKD